MKSRILAIVASIFIGIALGISIYTFIYAKGYSYLLNDPSACANCHIMNEQYDGWIKSSHHNVATCNDCHTPASFVGKYVSKASNGFWHSFAFTSGDFHEPIQIKPNNRKITEQACLKCHQDVVDTIEGAEQKDKISCLRCHNSVGHMH
ncbi:MAG: cytochrome c nitrite reductase small subunit [Acidobacteria bacterium]|nr:cytochrome c nitrite reductase small subunit [Acidobacteriota bacterium]